MLLSFHTLLDNQGRQLGTRKLNVLRTWRTLQLTRNSSGRCQDMSVGPIAHTFESILVSFWQHCSFMDSEKVAPSG